VATIQSYRDLRVWRAGFELVTFVYRVTDKFPDVDRFQLADEVRRTALAIPSSIADGHTRADTHEYLQLVGVAHGSVAKLQTQLEIAGRLGYINEFDAARVAEICDALSRQLNALRTALVARLPKHEAVHV
jgi:four helix bundle protein